jgi:hypothetical protein
MEYKNVTAGVLIVPTAEGSVRVPSGETVLTNPKRAARYLDTGALIPVIHEVKKRRSPKPEPVELELPTEE